MKVLVTGGTGLVGSAVRHVTTHERGRFGGQAGDEWVFVSSSECDLRDFEATKQLFDRVRPTHVLHLAAKVGGLFANMAQPADFYRDNVLINDNVLQNAHDHGVAKVVSCLSTCIFPDAVTYPLTEAKIHLGPPHASNFGYAYAKRMVDVQNRAYAQQYGDVFTSVVPTNVFGPGDNYSLTSAHVLPALMHKAVLALRSGAPFVTGGTGTPLRQFIYSRDLARLMVWAVREYEDVEPLILSPAEDDEVSISTVAEAVARAVPAAATPGAPALRIQYDASKPDGQARKPASNAKLVGLLPEFTFTPFEDALRESVEWFVEHYDDGARI